MLIASCATFIHLAPTFPPQIQQYGVGYCLRCPLQPSVLVFPVPDSWHTDNGRLATAVLVVCTSISTHRAIAVDLRRHLMYIPLPPHLERQRYRTTTATTQFLIYNPMPPHTEIRWYFSKHAALYLHTCCPKPIYTFTDTEQVHQHHSHHLHLHTTL